jgi:hypothetical protein
MGDMLYFYALLADYKGRYHGSLAIHLGEKLQEFMEAEFCIHHLTPQENRC